LLIGGALLPWGLAVSRCFAAVAVATFSLLSASSVNASPITIDFTNGGLYGSIGGTTSGPIVDQGIGITLTSSGGSLKHSSEGIGVDGPTFLDDSGEIGPTEQLNLFFPTTTLYSFGLSQLFPNERVLFASYVEKGQYQVNGGNWLDFNALNTSGNLTISFGAGLAGVSSLGFRTPFLGLLDDYSVTQLSLEALPPITPNVVPEPASMLLMGTGLAMGAFRKYRVRTRDTA